MSKTMKFRLLMFVGLGIALTGCAGTQMSILKNDKPISHSINRIAIGPGSGPFGDAIGVELFNMGFQIVDTNEAAAIIGRVGLKEFELYTPQGNTVLREHGIEAIITAKSVVVDGVPESASVRVTDTRDSHILAGITWQNGWGGRRGSIADRVMRTNLSSAAQEIAKELGKRLRY